MGKDRFLKLKLLFLFLTIIGSQGWAQNLVPNGDFEYKKGRHNSHRPWRFVNTVDFYVIGGEMEKRPKDSEKWNIPKPKSGKAFVGLRIYPDYREFIQVKLNEKLIDGKKYYFEMWVSWSDHSNYYAKQFGASFYRKKPAYTSKHFIYANPPQIELKQSRGIVQPDSTVWMKISGVYRAKGDERYLSIGNFSKDSFKDRLKKRRWWSLNFWHFEAYYYLDNVSLVQMEDYIPEKDSILVDNNVDTTIDYEFDNYVYKIQKDSTLVIENLIFESGSDRILHSSFRDLELVLEYLNEYQTQNVQIVGHTDDVGTESNNLKLSEKRAKSVYKYFIENRVDKSRISYIGKGESDPIASNETGLGKKANRRVEITLIPSK